MKDKYYIDLVYINFRNTFYSQNLKKKLFRLRLSLKNFFDKFK